MNYPPTHRYQAPLATAIEILYQDDCLMIVDKPAGLLSVPGRGEDKQDCLLSRLQQTHPEALLVHRLDMDTSGLMIFARTELAQRRLSLMFQQRQVHKEYQALVLGQLDNKLGTVELPLITDWPRRPLQARFRCCPKSARRSSCPA